MKPPERFAPAVEGQRKPELGERQGTGQAVGNHPVFSSMHQGAEVHVGFADVARGSTWVVRPEGCKQSANTKLKQSANKQRAAHKEDKRNEVVRECAWCLAAAARLMPRT